MPELEPIYLTFRAGLHVGRRGIGQEAVLAHVPSDTLFAALVTVRAQMKPEAGAWAERFRQVPPFRLTSAFPFAGGVRFYPRPVRLLADVSPKTWRKIRFVSEEVLKRLLAGDAPDRLLPKGREEEPADGLTLQNGALWLTRAEADQLPEPMRTKLQNGKAIPLPPRAIQRQRAWVEETVPRVTVDRITNASEIYHTGRVTFAPGCGLWFGVQWQDMAHRQELLDILHVLGDAGLGAERSAGYGAFDSRPDGKLTWPDPQPDGLMLLLSRYYPQAKEAESTLATPTGTAYELVRVAGRVHTVGEADQRRRGLVLVAEGSIVGGGAQGDLEDVKPTVGEYPHQVWRYGLALGVALGGGA